MKLLEDFIQAIGDTPEIRKEAEGIADLDSLVTFVNAHFNKLNPEQAEEFDEIDFDLTRELSIDELMKAAGGAGEESEGNEDIDPSRVKVIENYRKRMNSQKQTCTTTYINGVRRTICVWN